MMTHRCVWKNCIWIIYPCVEKLHTRMWKNYTRRVWKNYTVKEKIKEKIKRKLIIHLFAIAF